MIAQIEALDTKKLKYNTVGYVELDSNDIDRHNKLTYIGQARVRSVYNMPDDVLTIYPNAYKVSILTDEGIRKVMESPTSGVKHFDLLRNAWEKLTYRK